MSEKLQTFGFVRSIDEENRRVQVVVSTGDLARDDAIIDQSGWVFTNYDRNPVVLWAHDDHSIPIAKAIPSLRQQTENELIETHEFADHPAAEQVWNAVRGGFVSATSVRWLPGKTTIRQVNGRSVLVFTEGHELLESSYVPIPADPGCLVVRADGQRLTKRDPETGRMVIDFSMNCGIRGCPNDGWDATYDVCKWHHDLFQSGEIPVPSTDDEEAAKALAATEARGRRAAFDNDRIPDEGMYCCAADCRNPAPIAYALCNDCAELLDTARRQRAAQPDERAQRLAALADRIRTTNHQEGAA